MFDPKRPIEVTQETIDKITTIKDEIAEELQWFQWDIEVEWNRLFQEKVMWDTELSKIENI